MSVLERPVQPTSPFVGSPVDERAARRSLREQIARLEQDLVTVAVSAHPRLPLPPVPGRAGPRLLSLGELEALRDELAARVHDLRAERVRILDRQAESRLLIEKMLLEPGQYRWVRVTNDDIGEPGCKSWHVRPRLGLVGMLAGWWHVKVSSGCPLARGPWRPPRPRSPEADVGKRSRKRPTGPVQADPAPARRPVTSSGRRPGQGRMDRFLEKADERPKPPWHPVPLVELAVLVGLVLLIVGFINYDTESGRIAIAFGLGLASLAGLETAAREHFAGYRSHSTLLAGVPAILTLVVLSLAGTIPAIGLAAAALVFGIAFWALRGAFRRRAGVAFKV